MELTITVQDNTVSVQYNLTDKEKQVLHHLKEHKYLEFRGGRHGKTDDTDRFTQEDGESLLEYGFIDFDHDSWHTTFILTKLGEQVVQAQL